MKERREMLPSSSRSELAPSTYVHEGRNHHGNQKLKLALTILHTEKNEILEARRMCMHQ